MEIKGSMKTDIICSITPLGNVGNQIIQMMVAKTLEKYSGKIFFYNHLCPDFGYEFNSNMHEELLNSEDSLILRDNEIKNIHEIADKIKNNGINNIVLDGYFQHYSFLLDRDHYKNSFDILGIDNDLHIADNEILINIRAGEICNGIWAYPLVPISFYKYLVERTGYHPVFMGQIDESYYVKKLKINFPYARFVSSGGALRDMVRLRAASRICIAISTFSWVNAWLSEALEIYYPILGLLHPNVMNGYARCDVNLLPVNDSRYKYYLFPIIKGEKEDRYFHRIKKIHPLFKEVPQDFARFLSKNKSLVERKKNVHYENVDEDWYISQYILSAWEISEGFYVDAQHHYNEIGKMRGYEPYKKVAIDHYDNIYTKISKFNHVTQSSVCESSHGLNVDDDAKNALSQAEYHDYAFHTNFEKNPWWIVQFEEEINLRALAIYNRCDDLHCSYRIFPLSVEISTDGDNFIEIAKIQENSENVSILRTSGLFFIDFKEAHKAKFLRLIIYKQHEALHLRKIDIYV